MKNPYTKLHKTIKELLLNGKKDRELALETFESAKKQLQDALADPEFIGERDSLRKLMVETLKLAQSSKASSIKAIELLMKNQEAGFKGAGEEAKAAVDESFMGDE